MQLNQLHRRLPSLPTGPQMIPRLRASVVWDSHGLSDRIQLQPGADSEGGFCRHRRQNRGLEQRRAHLWHLRPRSRARRAFAASRRIRLRRAHRRRLGPGHAATVVLTLRSSTASTSNSVNPPAPSEEDTGSEEQSQQPPNEQAPVPAPQAPPNAYAPDVPVRTQQQIIQEMQERERQLSNNASNKIRRSKLSREFRCCWFRAES